VIAALGSPHEARLHHDDRQADNEQHERSVSLERQCTPKNGGREEREPATIFDLHRARVWQAANVNLRTLT
jgi:hypothetical protein